MCKHQKAVIIHFQLASTFLYTATPEEKCFWAHVAVGEKLSKDPNYFFKYEESEIHGVEVASANPCCSKSLSPPPSTLIDDTFAGTAPTRTVDEERVERCNSITKLFCEKVDHSTEGNVALAAFERKWVKTCTSAQVHKMLHNAHLSVSYRKNRTMIRVQPKSTSRRRDGQTRSTRPQASGGPVKKLHRRRGARDQEIYRRTLIAICPTPRSIRLVKEALCF